MTTWVMGDVQGCDDALGRLLGAIAFDPACDRVWLLGDVVNRGPDSLAVLRRCVAGRGAIRAVLGNHDIHLLARAAGVATAGPRDTLDALLDAPDRDALLAWLRSQPLLQRLDHHVLVHAGLWPQWTVAEAEARAAAASAALQGPLAQQVLSLVRGADRDHPADGSVAAHAATIAILTRIRALDRDGRLARFSGTLAALPPDHRPWFAERRAAHGRVGGPHDRLWVGHWAALDVVIEPDLVTLDGGCVWGRRLVAARLADGVLVEVPAR